MLIAGHAHDIRASVNGFVRLLGGAEDGVVVACLLAEVPGGDEHATCPGYVDDRRFSTHPAVELIGVVFKRLQRYVCDDVESRVDRISSVD
jgi:hypothetical protein